MRFFLLFLFSLSILHLSCHEQKEEGWVEGIVVVDSLPHSISDSVLRAEDSIKVSALVLDFYYWYIGSAKGFKALEFNPSFEPDSLGYATLYLKKYTKNLYDHNFTDALVQRVIERYNPCLENLKHIKYDSLMAFEDLGQYEEINCDFGNVYDWTGGQEMIDGIRILNVKMHDDKSCVVQVRFYNVINNKISYLSESYSTQVHCIKEYDTWKIDNVDGFYLIPSLCL